MNQKTRIAYAMRSATDIADDLGAMREETWFVRTPIRDGIHYTPAGFVFIGLVQPPLEFDTIHTHVDYAKDGPGDEVVGAYWWKVLAGMRDDKMVDDYHTVFAHSAGSRTVQLLHDTLSMDVSHN